MATSVEMRYPMYLMHVSDFLRIGTMDQHEMLRDAGKLVTWTPGMKRVFFVSHQWSSFDHPDPNHSQLRVLQRMLLRMMSGSVPATAPTFANAIYLRSGVTVQPHEWAEILPEAYLWLDYFSVPQMGEFHDDEELKKQMTDAIASIPAYVERSSHFFALVPTLRHHDLSCVTCDYGSWLDRGWCRLEMWALLLARFNSLPVIVIKGGEATPFMNAPQSVMTRPPGIGNYTCCERGHRIPDKNGVMRQVPCDKTYIGPVMAAMLKAKLDHLRITDQTALYRIWCAFAPHILQGLPDTEELVNSHRPQSVQEFLRLFRFTSVDEEAGKGGSGYTPLFLACLSGNVPVARDLLQAHKASLHVETRLAMTEIGISRGCNPILASMFTGACTQIDDLIKVLLDAGSDPNYVGSGAPGPPMHAAVWMNNKAALQALLKHGKGQLDIDQGTKLNNASALGVAAYAGTPEIVELLIDAGANVTHLNDMGTSLLTNAAENPATTPDMLARICASKLLDVNYACKPRTRKWYLIERVFELVYKRNLMPKTDLVMDVAHTRGSTALHFAARHGHLPLVVWLLQHGAHESLRVRNKLGFRPIDMATLFGPYPEVEALLGSAEIDPSFDTKSAKLNLQHDSSATLPRRTLPFSHHYQAGPGSPTREKALEQRVAALEEENAKLRAPGPVASSWQGMLGALEKRFAESDQRIADLERRNAVLEDRNAELEAANLGVSEVKSDTAAEPKWVSPCSPRPNIPTCQVVDL